MAWVPVASCMRGWDRGNAGMTSRGAIFRKICPAPVIDQYLTGRIHFTCAHCRTDSSGKSVAIRDAKLNQYWVHETAAHQMNRPWR